LLRVLASRWLGQPPAGGRFFILGTATVSVLGWDHGGAAIERWNIPAGPGGPAPRPGGPAPGAQ
ncbi:MAG TPA: histidine phosphatase family protein, partial [Acidimicrobiales bacterium]|nr:histidine phosphatase family protein [Acidimicrobiales bacterium]